MAPSVALKSHSTTVDAGYDDVVAALAMQTELPVVIAVAVLPQQRLLLTVVESNHLAMIAHCLDADRRFAMLGRIEETGQVLSYGTECEIVASEVKDDGSATVEVVGRRQFTLSGEPWIEEVENLGGYQMARVNWNEEAAQSYASRASSEEEVASVQLEQRVQIWSGLVRRHRNQEAETQQTLEETLENLGPMPGVERGPSYRAMWVAALINPGHGMNGVANDVRHVMLAARNHTERLSVVTSTLEASIRHLQAGARL